MINADFGVFVGCDYNMDYSLMISILGFIIALFSLGVSFWQYLLHKKQMKTELLTKYSVRHRVDKDINTVFKYLEQEIGYKMHYQVKTPDSHQIVMFLTYFEDMELLIRAEAIDEKIVSYMFYDYVHKFEQLKVQWKDIHYESDKWKIYHEFYARMERIKGDNNNYNIN